MRSALLPHCPCPSPRTHPESLLSAHQVCGTCGNFNGEEEDELTMPSDELAHNDTEFVDSWQDKETDPK